MIPGKSSNWILQFLWCMTPGMQVSVVNSYAAVSDLVEVKVDRMVDLPTEGKPMSATRASPTFSTSKPSPAAEAPLGGCRSSVRYFASFARSEQRCDIVALLICVRAISFSMSLILSTRPDMVNGDQARAGRGKGGAKEGARRGADGGVRQKAYKMHTLSVSTLNIEYSYSKSPTYFSLLLPRRTRSCD